MAAAYKAHNCALRPEANQIRFTLLSEPGKRCEILASTNVALPASNWTIVRTVTNLTGTAPVSEPADAHPRRFYQARQLE